MASGMANESNELERLKKENESLKERNGLLQELSDRNSKLCAEQAEKIRRMEEEPLRKVNKKLKDHNAWLQGRHKSDFVKYAEQNSKMQHMESDLTMLRSHANQVGLNQKLLRDAQEQALESDIENLQLKRQIQDLQAKLKDITDQQVQGLQAKLEEITEQQVQDLQAKLKETTDQYETQNSGFGGAFAKSVNSGFKAFKEAFLGVENYDQESISNLKDENSNLKEENQELRILNGKLNYEIKEARNTEIKYAYNVKMIQDVSEKDPYFRKIVAKFNFVSGRIELIDFDKIHAETYADKTSSKKDGSANLDDSSVSRDNVVVVTEVTSAIDGEPVKNMELDSSVLPTTS